MIEAAMNATKTIPIVMVGGGSDPVEAGYVQGLACPGGNVTGVTNLGRELGGKRLELLKEAVPKLPHRCSLDPTLPGSVLDVEEVLPVAARACGWLFNLGRYEMRTVERVFAALNKERPDGLLCARKLH